MLPGEQSQSEIPFHDQTNVLDDNDSRFYFFSSVGNRPDQLECEMLDDEFTYLHL